MESGNFIIKHLFLIIIFIDFIFIYIYRFRIFSTKIS